MSTTRTRGVPSLQVRNSTADRAHRHVYYEEASNAIRFNPAVVWSMGFGWWGFKKNQHIPISPSYFQSFAMMNTLNNVRTHIWSSYFTRPPFSRGWATLETWLCPPVRGNRVAIAGHCGIALAFMFVRMS